MFFVQLLVFGASVGVISGMLGIGGGIVLVPGLMLLFSFTQREAMGTSLAALIPPIGIFAALVYYQNGYVRIPVAGAVAVGFMVGAYFGARLIPLVPTHWLGFAFGALLLYLGFRFVFDPTLSRPAAALPIVLAAILVTIGAWLRGKKLIQRPHLPPPDGHTEYHI